MLFLHWYETHKLLHEAWIAMGEAHHYQDLSFSYLNIQQKNNVESTDEVGIAMESQVW